MRSKYIICHFFREYAPDYFLHNANSDIRTSHHVALKVMRADSHGEKDGNFELQILTISAIKMVPVPARHIFSDCWIIFYTKALMESICVWYSKPWAHVCTATHTSSRVQEYLCAH